MGGEVKGCGGEGVWRGGGRRERERRRGASQVPKVEGSC